MFFSRKSKNHLGVEIDGTNIRIVSLSAGTANNKLQKDNILLEAGSVANGVIVEPDHVAERLSLLTNRNGWQGLNATTTIISRQVVVRQMQLPRLGEKELNEAIKWEATQYLPYSYEEAVIAWHNLGNINKAEPDKDTILLAAVPKELAYSYYHLFRETKVKLIAIDIISLALKRWLFYRGNENGAGAQVITLGVVNIGREMTKVVILKEGKVHFVRTIAFGVQNLINAVEQTHGIYGAKALEAIIKSFSTTDLLIAEDIDAGVEFTVNNAFEMFTMELKKSFDYYRNQLKGQQPRRLLITGELGQAPGLHKTIETTCNVSVQAYITENDASPEPQYALATGLALKGVV